MSERSSESARVCHRPATTLPAPLLPDSGASLPLALGTAGDFNTDRSTKGGSASGWCNC